MQFNLDELSLFLLMAHSLEMTNPLSRAGREKLDRLMNECSDAVDEKKREKTLEN